MTAGTQVPHPVERHPLSTFFNPGRAHSRRASSHDRSGGNQDFVRIEPGEVAVLLDHEGAGCVTHLYCAMVLPDLRDYRNAVLRCHWDGSDRPSVEVPLGDFFALAHARVRQFTSALIAVNPGCGASHGLNAYFPMPFSSGARITLENEGPAPLGGPLGAFWYHVDYEAYDEPVPDGTHRFHASYRQECSTEAVGRRPNATLHDGLNQDGTENYVALDTDGAGRLVGLVLEVENRQGRSWYGEGDDMVFVDSDAWPPKIHGTGTEEIFGGGACPSSEYVSFFSGFHLVESADYEGLVGMYRWYVHDLIHFSRSLRWTVEHGHANNFSNGYASVAYWYQSPQAALPRLPGPVERRPPLDRTYDEAWTALTAAAERALGSRSTGEVGGLLEVCSAGQALYRGDFHEALDSVHRLGAGMGGRAT